MLELRHFVHLAEFDPLVEQLVSTRSGMTVIAGAGTRAQGHVAASEDGFLPSGSSTILGILARRILTARVAIDAVIVYEGSHPIRMPRLFKRRIKTWQVRPPNTYAGYIAAAIHAGCGLLIVDQLNEETTVPALDAAQQGMRVFAELDTVFYGADVVRHVCDLGADEDQLQGLHSVVTVQRMPMLCQQCKQPVIDNVAQVDLLCRRFPERQDAICTTQFYDAPGCASCHQTGQRSSVMAFDVYYHQARGKQSVLSLDEYLLGLAVQGYLAPRDVLEQTSRQLYRTFSLLTENERALSAANAALRRKVVELEAANRVLEQRTEALVSLHDVGQALIAGTEIEDLARRVCRHASELCGAEYVVLYFRTGEKRAEILAVQGWDRDLVGHQLDAQLVFGGGAYLGEEAVPFTGYPPGVTVEGERRRIRTGLQVPLVAQEWLVGSMIVQSCDKDAFVPGQVALLRTLAGQAAVSFQRAGLFEQLRIKVAELEAAQAELVQKERLERELELARQVQQSVLPRVFPDIPGCVFAARNRPAREVGGDFYDVIQLDRDHVGLVIADVSDKGMPAALYMALTRSLLLAEARRALSPRAVLEAVNRLLLELGQPSMFVSVFYGVLALSTSCLTYVRAGHNRPLLLRHGTTSCLEGVGACLGIFEPQDLVLREACLDLARGDLLVLYTDGMIDVLNGEGELFGKEKFELLLQACDRKPPQELCATVFSRLAAYQGGVGQYDDMTMLVLGIESAPCSRV